MTKLLEALTGASATDRESFRPEFFRLPVDKARLEELLKQETRIRVYDTLHGQLTELVRSLNPSIKFSKAELDLAAKAHLGNTPSEEYGVWVYYPWDQRLVHLLDEAEFVLVRTDRNRNKITSEEQALLATKKVGVIGLSVGQSVSLTMALERSFGEIRLADFDTLELSNLNRIRSGVHEMGVPKVINTAREIAELDPFLEVTVFTDGITKANLHRFFTAGGKLDVLIEECDSVDIKILARLKAKELGVPVVMDMSDRGCLDVERFDLEPDRPIMHGWIDHLDLDAASRPMTNEEKIPFMLPIVGTDTLSIRLKASVMELGHSVSTWPQLATSVVLGGALAGDTQRRILLGQTRKSGRWFIDLNDLIDGDQVPPTDAPPPIASRRDSLELEMAQIADRLPNSSPDAAPIEKEVALEIVEAGALAPSAGNCQPWRFRVETDRILLFHDMERSASRWDPDHIIGHIALGTCLENMILRAQQLGYDVRTNASPVPGSPSLVATLEIVRQGHAEAESREFTVLAPAIKERCTNRKLTIRQPLPEGIAPVLTKAARSIDGCTIELFDTDHQLSELAAICGGSEKIRIMDRVGHHEFFVNELRWSPDEALKTGDGLDIATMELTPGDAAALRIAADGRAIALLDQWRGGRSLERFSRKGITSASAVVLISVDGTDLESRLRGGRAAQRVWMQANQMGIGVHPISAPIFLFHAMSVLDDLAPHHAKELGELKDRFEELRDATEGQALFMMRLALNGIPSVRSLRRPIEQMLLSDNAQTA